MWRCPESSATIALQRLHVTRHILETVPPALDGERIDRIVSLICGCSRAESARLLSIGAVLVDDAVTTKASTKLTEGQQIAIAYDGNDESTVLQPEPDVPFDIVFVDDHIIVVNKPVGLVVHPGAGTKSGTLANGLLAQFPEIATVGERDRPGIVHRLDRGTSGLMVVARTQDAYTDLVAQLANHEVERIYAALVWGHFDHHHGVVDAPIGRSRRDPLRMTITAEGKPARTHFHVQEEFFDPAEMSLISCQLETGRTHQIRVHLSSVGHSVIGDHQYGGQKRRYEFPRPALHARQLSFEHPQSYEPVTFTAELPADMATALEDLRGRERDRQQEEQRFEEQWHDDDHDEDSLNDTVT